jgi:hypothetical protein
LAELWVPGEEVVRGEVVEVGDDGAAGFVGFDEVGCLAWGFVLASFYHD